MKGIKLTTEEFIKKAKLVHGDKYDYSLVDYKKTNEKVKIICSIHGIFEQTPKAHLNVQGCPMCSGNKKETNSSFIERAKLVHGDKYDYSLVNYVNNKTKVKIICSVHGIFEQIPNAHLNKQGCPKCALEKNKQTKPIVVEEFVKRANKIHGNKYDYSKVDYINSQTKIKIICPIHGVFEQKPANHLRGAGCSKCRSSHGEETIRSYLLKNNILFEEQKRFKECKNIKPLPFDFYIPKKNLLIEYNGRQHYETVEHFGGREQLKIQRHNDWLKRKFARDNHINLLVISYKENIEDLLDKKVF